MNNYYCSFAKTVSLQTKFKHLRSKNHQAWNVAKLLSVLVIMVDQFPIYCDDTLPNDTAANDSRSRNVKIVIISPFRPNPCYCICNDSRYTYYVCCNETIINPTCSLISWFSVFLSSNSIWFWPKQLYWDMHVSSVTEVRGMCCGNNTTWLTHHTNNTFIIISSEMIAGFTIV